ncbi:hypothetical protein SAMN05421810_102422 [Amycolatopsis arida]|uniref:Prealbumin-like fold domain-containing protein n=1 Tax=Amycolatopsis arida TaxID=587909 RepID=A0A1I5PW54_9PSEU|nr:hypothetical protein [Amycolatopsis arida]TDX98629.1 hypothetical protein CLV69_101422 [Amycolatopsis arida]SFP38323.1 hypothetical protein SAMN05421810_102422 [Amycolatopsis arida]
MGHGTHPGSAIGGRSRLLSVLTVTVLGALGVVAPAQPVAAEPPPPGVEEGVGHEVPGQTYRDRSGSTDWLGTYVVRDEHVFCVQFAFKAPKTGEEYEPGDELLTKWGDPLAPDVAANISYLLLRHGDTRDADEAAALAHLLHSWTAAPRDGHDDLNPTKGFEEIGYDVELHLSGLPEGAKDAVERLRADAETNRGPWTASVTPPKGEQTIGTAGEWTISVRNARDAGVPDVPITLTLTDAVLDGDEPADPVERANTEASGSTEDSADRFGTGVAEGAEDTEPAAEPVTVTTGKDGTATVRVVPTGQQPKVVATLSAPADRPYVRHPVRNEKTQRVVSTGGERELTAEGVTKARTQPGVVRVAKVDSRTGDGIAGVALRLTGEDRTSPALGQDDQPLLGADGEPTVVITEGADGTVTVENLRTPQEVCVVEVSPPSGYDQAFDPADPPAACGRLEAGDTLVLEVANAPNDVPRTIPAGTAKTMAQSATRSAPSGAALAALGGLALLGSMLVGWVARRRFTGR